MKSALHSIEADPIEEIGLDDTEFLARMGTRSIEKAVNRPVATGMLAESTARIHRRR